MPLDYVSYQFDLGQLEHRIETLERGRAVLWSEMRLLRISVDQLMQADPQLGYKFAAISRDLEELTKYIPQSHILNINDGGADDLKAVDPFGRLPLKQRRLLEECNKLISQIQTLPSLNTFLRSPSFDTLRSASSSGPLILINHSIRCSDNVILLHKTLNVLESAWVSSWGREGDCVRLEVGEDCQQPLNTITSPSSATVGLTSRRETRRLWGKH